MADRRFTFNELSTADLVVDVVYQGQGKAQLLADEPLHRLLPVGNQGGFRYHGSKTDITKFRMVVLFTSLADSDWPDTLHEETGVFTYFRVAFHQAQPQRPPAWRVRSATPAKSGSKPHSAILRLYRYW